MDIVIFSTTQKNNSTSRAYTEPPGPLRQGPPRTTRTRHEGKGPAPAAASATVAQMAAREQQGGQHGQQYKKAQHASTHFCEKFLIRARRRSCRYGSQRRCPQRRQPADGWLAGGSAGWLRAVPPPGRQWSPALPPAPAPGCVLTGDRHHNKAILDAHLGKSPRSLEMLPKVLLALLVEPLAELLRIRAEKFRKFRLRDAFFL